MHRDTYSLNLIAQSKGYATKKRHIFVCVSDACASKEDNLRLWDYLKKKLKEREPDPNTATIMRSKVDCLRICKGGTIALVYPEGTMYHDLNETKLDRVIDEHLFGGMPVEECLFFEKGFDMG